MLKHFFLYGLLSSAISNIIAFQQPDPSTNEGELTNWSVSSVLTKDGSRMFYALSDLPMSWDEAYAYCSTIKGFLAEPRSSGETEEVNKVLDGRSAWIGLTDKGTEGLFLWSSDAADTQSYHNWGEYGDYGPEPTGDGDCVLTWMVNDGKWNDYPCNHVYGSLEGPIYALCQKNS